MRDATEIGLILYPGVQEAALLGITDMFEIANGIAAATARSIETSRWALDSESDALRKVGEAKGGSWPTVFLALPGKGPPISREVAPGFRGSLRQFHEGGGILASVCGGSFLLAETGLLDGRAATTHFAFQEEFRSRFPEVHLAIDRLIVDDGDIVTAGGMMAWTDLGLKLVERYLGATVMLETARTLLVDPPGREQSYYGTFVPTLGHGDAAILATQHWLHSNFAQDVSVAAMAAKAGMSERTFLRKFSAATGMTSIDYLQHVRINKAREMLQFGSSSIDQVAWDVGYTDTSAFRKIFMRIVGLAPTEYRRRFTVGATRVSSVSN